MLQLVFGYCEHAWGHIFYSLTTRGPRLQVYKRGFFMRNNLFLGVETIQSEYRRIDGSWLRIQYRLLLWLAAFTPVAELAVYLLLRHLDALDSSWVFLLKYMLTPLLYDGVLALIATAVMRSRLTEKQKIYGISLLLTAMAFGVYTIHSIFPSLYVIFIIPMVLTVIYGDRRLTTFISALCLAGKMVSDLFLFWDAGRPNVFSSTTAFTDFCVSLLLMVLFYVICWLLLNTEQAKNNVSLNLEQERLRYQKKSMTDALTQVGNRLALRAAFQSMEEQQHQAAFYLAMMDLDAFKQLNDTFGHNQGDRYLRGLGSALLDLSTQDIQPFRFGGDEFCILFRGHNLVEVRETCQKLQETFSQADIHRRCQPVTISIGIAEYQPGEKPSLLLERADRALYQAKQEKGSITFCE